MGKDKQHKYDKAYLEMAQTWGQLSYCERKKVGALIVKDRMIISDGYNGTPSGFENICEDPLDPLQTRMKKRQPVAG